MNSYIELFRERSFLTFLLSLPLILISCQHSVSSSPQSNHLLSDDDLTIGDDDRLLKSAQPQNRSVVSSHQSVGLSFEDLLQPDEK